MENSINTDESFDRGVRRIYTTLAGETKTIIDPPHRDIHESIHNTRKSLKFIRALLRLVKSPLGPDLFEQENYGFRDMGRLMSDLRDAHVLPVIMNYVASEAHAVTQSDIKEGIAELERRAARALDEARSPENRFVTIASELESAAARSENWPEIPDSLDALLPGLKEVYQKGRVGFLEARDSSSKGHFHEWRKQVKYLLHQYEILVNYWPDSLGINGKSLQQLSDYLGEEHDLALFDELLNDSQFSDKLDNVKALGSFVDQKRSFLQRSALNLGDYIYSRPEDEFISLFKESADVRK